MRSDLVEIPRGDLTFHKFGLIEASDGRLYRARRDAAADIGFEGAVAYYTDQTGYPHLLEESCRREDPPGARPAAGRATGETIHASAQALLVR